ncbi:MAG TPA: hypothetical protein DCW31_01525 [Lactobacillus sp.]|nr:hypothetical protein [Lactobacillus sp.]
MEDILLSDRILLAVDILAVSGHESDNANLGLFLGVDNIKLEKAVSILKKRRLLVEKKNPKVCTLTLLGAAKVRLLHKRCETWHILQEQIPDSMMLNGDGLMLYTPATHFWGHGINNFRM